MTAKKRKDTKLFVIDTNVLMHDPKSLFKFQEHDIFIPDRVLEELDNNKKGTTEVNRNTRKAMRLLDALMIGKNEDKDGGFALSSMEGEKATGKLFFQTEDETKHLGKEKESSKADNEILAVTKHLAEKHDDREVVLVYKDINIRIKARARKILNEDYTNDQITEESDMEYSGIRHHTDVEFEALMSGVPLVDGRTGNMLEFVECENRDYLVNEIVVDPERQNGYIVETSGGARHNLRRLYDYRKGKPVVWGIKAKNLEQSFALNFLMDPKIHLVTLMGQAGTGKTLLTLATALEQVIEKRLYHEIIVTRATVPIGDEIGFLPGAEEEKMLPWMGAIVDNLEYLRNYSERKLPRGAKDSEDVRYSAQDVSSFMMNHIKMRSISFMRGRTFIRKFIIIDEAQNLTRKEMKTLITRAGPGTKIICLGNIAQIDTPYLSESSSGLTHLVTSFKGWHGYGHVTLKQGERSPLADHAVDVL
jgi:PhoH-like ATPase